MATGIDEQLRALIAALITGGAVGLLYDAMHPLRGGLRRRILCVFTFTLLCAWWIHLTGRRAGVGSSAGYLSGVAAGVCAYCLVLHSMMERLSLFDKAMNILQVINSKTGAETKKE